MKITQPLNKMPTPETTKVVSGVECQQFGNAHPRDPYGGVIPHRCRSMGCNANSLEIPTLETPREV